MTDRSWEPKPLEVDYDQPTVDSRRTKAGIEEVRRNWQNTVFVVGKVVVMGIEGLVVMPLEEARRLASLHDALRTAQTWGDFLARIANDPKTRADLDDLYEGELPDADEPFSYGDDIPGYGDGDWPLWPAQAMLDWLPESVKALGTTEFSTFNGPCLYLDPDVQPEVIEALTAEGIECREDTEGIVASASGY